MRMTIGAGIVAAYAALTAAELWSERRRALQRRWPAIVVPVLHGFVLMLPILLVMYWRLAKQEEREIETAFGDQYRRYASDVPAFLPRLGRLFKTKEGQIE